MAASIPNPDPRELTDRLRRELADLEARIAPDPDNPALVEQATRLELDLSAWEIDAAGQ